VKIIIRLFFNVTKEHEKEVIRPSLKCRSGGYQPEDFLKEIFFSLPFPSGTANIPKNVKKMISPELKIQVLKHHP
jgi:hypothetical protein